MKLKELPESLYYAFKLRYRSTPGKQASSKAEVPVVISLTTIESRLGVVDLVIRSLLAQSVSPKKILLWIPESLQKALPEKLTDLCGEIFEIHTTHLHCSHKKLVHTLSAFPKIPIISCDDDLMYRPQWLALLYQESQRFPQSIIANQTRTIITDSEGNFLPYSKWPTNRIAEEGSDWVLPIGAEGVLYPPGSLDSRYDNEDLFHNLAPKADDLWFKSMSLLKGTKCRLATNREKKAIPIMGSQKSSLKHINIKKDLNSFQWKQLSDYFKLQEILKKD
ncbi:hypothetical protein [Muriicola soli]|uniref:Uncharacterized protein n=1 Tax=Muriicola soli TaxID=2507538 RepID=A0A411EA93_9FLAO|nr:hypothetical protein [Muriicola soli]QBA64645.1 hypothetical protein EQY75_08960 [Muriicola soli]